MKSKVLVSVGKLNFPQDLAVSLSDIAEVEYVSGDYSTKLPDADAVVVSMESINKTYLNKAPKLKIVARFGVGYDTVDIEACTKRGVYVGYTPDILSAAVADLTWALILGWMRRIPEGDNFARKEWGNNKRVFPFGWDLQGKTLGFLGLGRIGAEVAKRGYGYDVKMIYHDLVRRGDYEEKFGLNLVGFKELLQTSDILTIHIPLTSSTRKMIAYDQLRLMKPTALLVNTSRGGIIDQIALTEALEHNLIAGAALDVFEQEPIPLNDRLLKLNNVLLTPHCASATLETRRNMAKRCSENIRAVLKGEKPLFVIPEQSTYNF